MRVQLLGELRAWGDGGEPLVVRGPKQRMLLALLALHRGRAVGVDLLVDAVWREELPGNPANAVQAQIAQLRRVLGATSIVTTEGGYALSASIDIDEFEALVEQGRQRQAAGEVEEAAAILRDALALCEAEPLAEFASAEFALGERARLGELRLLAVEARVEADLALGRGEVAGELQALCREHPLREKLWALQMMALYRSGRQADALRAYAEVRDILVEELGVDPGPELQRLEAMILAHDPALERPAAERDGGHRAGNLPAALTRFVGREAELGELRRLLQACRLVTVVGPGGAGKSRLALEAVAAIRAGFSDGAWLVELAPVTDAAGVVPAIAISLGVTEVAQPGRSGSAGSALAALTTHLVGQSVLLVLDNCEQVIGEAAIVAESLLKATPGLRILTTSREPLGITGEQLVVLGPLEPSDAFELFADRAGAVAPSCDFAGQRGMVQDVCRQLDGLPLAIELAAARLRALPLAQLARRLEDRFRLLTGGARTALPRHQTLKAVVDWSYKLLFSDEQLLFRRVAVFVGSFDLDAADKVCADEELPASDIVELLSRLVDKSLVVPSPGDGPEARFTQLQTLWQYGRDRLEESGDSVEVCSRHAAYYRQMGEDAQEGLRGATGPRWQARLRTELANLRAALDWYAARGEAEAALSLATGMAWSWFLSGDFSEGARWQADALAVPGPVPAELQGLARAWLGYFVCMTTSPAAGLVECDAASSVLAAAKDSVLRAEGQLLHAAVLMRARQFPRSLELLREVEVALERAPHPWLQGTHDLMVAFNRASLGQLEEAEVAARSSLEQFDATGEVLFSIDPLNILAGVAEARGQLDRACEAYESLLARCRTAGDFQRTYIPFRLVRLAAVRARLGDDAGASALYEEAIGSSYNPWVRADALVGRASALRRLGDTARARRLLEDAGRQYDAAGQSADQTRVLAGLAWCALAEGEQKLAVDLANQAFERASGSGDPTMILVAQTARAAARALAEPTPANTEAFVDLAARRHEGVPYGPLFDEPDVAGVLARLRQS